MGLGQLFEIKPRCCRGSLLRDELGLRQFETQNDLTRSFPRVPAGTLGRLGSPNLTQAGRYFRGNLWPSAIGRKVMKTVHKPVALAWRQRASSALRARAAATLPPAFMNNSHDFCPTSTKTRRKLPARNADVLVGIIASLRFQVSGFSIFRRPSCMPDSNASLPSKIPAWI